MNSNGIRRLGASGAVALLAVLGVGAIGDGAVAAATAPAFGAGSISLGEDHGCAVTQNATVKCWGLNNEGQVGNGSLAGGVVTKPVNVVGLNGVASLAVGDNHSCALLKTGTVKCWGDNGSGELGNGTTVGSAKPVSVKGVGGHGVLSNVTAIASGMSHSCALVKAGTEVCWGQNQYGVLGNGTTINSHVPVNVINLGSVKSISTGNQDSCAVLKAKTVKCWGYNEDGELGPGTRGPESCLFGDFESPCDTKPIGVRGISSVVAASIRSNSVCALLSNGTVKCWGNDQPTFATVAGFRSATAITSGGAPSGQYSCVLLKDTTVKCWGFNADGELGNGTTRSTTVPSRVSGLTGASVVAGGGRFTCARMMNGAAECWGSGVYGELGNGSGANHTKPVEVVGF